MILTSLKTIRRKNLIKQLQMKSYFFTSSDKDSCQKDSQIFRQTSKNQIKNGHNLKSEECSQKSATMNFFKKIDSMPKRRATENQTIIPSDFLAKELNHYYMMLQASPREDHSAIIDKFMQLKRKYIKRSFYLPNKREYLQQLDRSFSALYLLHQKHQNIELGSLNNQIRKISSKQSNNARINLEIQQQIKQRQQQFRWQFYTNNKMIISTSYVLIFVCGWVQYFLFKQ